MSRSRRRRAHRYQHILNGLPPRYIGEMRIPPELVVLLPPKEPGAYVVSRDMLHYVTLTFLEYDPDVQFVVMTLDILGGIHDLRFHDWDEYLDLDAVVTKHARQLHTFPIPTCLVAIEHVDAPNAIGPAHWDDLRLLTDSPVDMIDVLMASPDDQIVWSAAYHYGPDPFESPLSERWLDAQAGKIRTAVGLDTRPRTR